MRACNKFLLHAGTVHLPFAFLAKADGLPTFLNEPGYWCKLVVVGGEQRLCVSCLQKERGRVADTVSLKSLTSTQLCEDKPLPVFLITQKYLLLIVFFVWQDIILKKNPVICISDSNEHASFGSVLVLAKRDESNQYLYQWNETSNIYIRCFLPLSLLHSDHVSPVYCTWHLNKHLQIFIIPHLLIGSVLRSFPQLSHVKQLNPSSFLI